LSTINFFEVVEFCLDLEKDEDLVARDELRRERGKERQRERNLTRAPDKRYVIFV